jgi:hypothetical protein
MVSLALSVNLRDAEYCRAQHRGLPSVAKAFGVPMSTDALRNPISVEKLQGPIVMITAVCAKFIYKFPGCQDTNVKFALRGLARTGHEP